MKWLLQLFSPSGPWHSSRGPFLLEGSLNLFTYEGTGKAATHTQPKPYPGGILTNAASMASPGHTFLPGQVIPQKIALSRIGNGLGPLLISGVDLWLKCARKGNKNALIHLGN